MGSFSQHKTKRNEVFKQGDYDCDISKCGVWNIDDWISWCFFAEYIYVDYLSTTLFQLLHNFCFAWCVMLRKRICEESILEADLYFRRFLVSFESNFELENECKATFHKWLTSLILQSLTGRAWDFKIF